MTQVGKIDAGKRMKELENRQFPSQNAASQPQLLHKELVRKRKVMISELYQAVEKGDMDNLVDAMQRVCDGRSKNSTIVKFILSHYAKKKTKHDGIRNREITRETNKYKNPLHEVVYSGDVDGVKEILLADKDVVHYLNKSRRSPLYLAVVNANISKHLPYMPPTQASQFMDFHPHIDENI
ncbi:hypothetical protein JHK82_050770 [Glycine max]|nr:hypothetical protein JHK82_050770 [Glycine max]